MEIYFGKTNKKNGYWVTPEEIKEMIETNHLIENAIEDIKECCPPAEADIYDIAKIVFDDMRDIMKSVTNEKVWITEECNKYFFQFVKERVPLDMH